MYADKLADVGLYYRQMAAYESKLKELYRPRMGDGMLSPDRKPWMLGVLDSMTPELEPNNLAQIAASPLNSNLVVDAWSGEVSLSGAARIAPPSLDDKRPFQVLPVFFRLHPALTTPVSQSAQGEVTDGQNTSSR